MASPSKEIAVASGDFAAWASNSRGKTGDPASDTNLAEEVLRQSGKGSEEVEAVGTIDRADEVFETTLAKRFRTSESPVAKGVFGTSPVSLFAPLSRPEVSNASPDYLAVMANCIDIVSSHAENGLLFDEHQKISDTTIRELSEAGYFGLLIDPEFGGEWVETQELAGGDPTRDDQVADIDPDAFAELGM